MQELWGAAAQHTNAPAPIGGRDHARPPISDIYIYMPTFITVFDFVLFADTVSHSCKIENKRIIHEIVAAPHLCIPSRIELLLQSAKGAATNAHHTMLQLLIGLIECIHVTLFLVFHL